MTAPEIAVIGGIDTLTDVRQAAVINSVGRHLDTQPFKTNSAGYEQLLTWLRAQGKFDPIDACAAATAVLSGCASGTLKSRDGIVKAIRALCVVRKSAVKARTQTINQIRALMVTAPSALRDKLRGLLTSMLIDTLPRTRPAGDLTDPACAAKTALRRLARRYQALQQEIKDDDAGLAPVVTRAAQPRRTAGLSTETASQLLISAGDSPDRLRSEASFARQCGAAPIPPRPAGPTVTASTAAGTVTPTAPSTPSSWSASSKTDESGTTSPDAPPRACPPRTSCAA